MTEAALCTTTNVLHPRQVTDITERKRRLEKMLAGPEWVTRQLQDGGKAVMNQVGELDRMLTQAPKPFAADEVDDAVRLEGELRTAWLKGMPTQAEMRKNMPGAVDKHRNWEQRCKAKVLQWKHLRRRLHASGISEHRLADEGDVSNIEIFRPRGGAQELAPDNAQIPGQDYFLPPAGAGPAVVLRDEDRALLQAINPELLAEMATLSNEERGRVVSTVRQLLELNAMPDPLPSPRVEKATPAQLKRKAKPKRKRSWSPERRAAARESMLAIHARRRAAKEAAEA